ncbi:SLATT domain-containing protein [Riemerella anatipestifer]|uniref:SLATT domain-containing protein n=1 Tax=Riemerella anatipestifer TaxID=34085 RepID=UPI00129D7100|nr:SLATT domain-containing protein [Riemerella anatipestifer]MRM84327.1 SLATT domain-containing protein [Riemerella anatipestifer]USL95192.1 SLATT domain-containing protein [Riemerella anatipestifer]
MTEYENKSIFQGSKEYLEKSFLEELNYKIWSTKGARFEADKRLTIVSKTSSITLSIFSAYLIISGLISVYNINSDIKIDVINYVVTALSILLLVLSQYENSQNYNLRANNYHNCGLELSKLYNELRNFKTLHENPSEYTKREFALKLSQEYQNILSKYENHLTIDYQNFKISHREYFTEIQQKDINKIKRINFWIRYGWYTLILILTPILIFIICLI